MHKFDVKYTYDNYYEYYKFVLIRQRILKDVLFFILFAAVAVYWWVDTSESTTSNVLPIISIIFACGMPLMNLITIPMIKKQLHSRQADIDRTHIVVTFNEDEIVYENLTEEPLVDNTPINVKEEEPVEEKLEETEVASEETQATEEKPEEVKEDEKIFNLKYLNFLIVRETKNLFMFYLDRQTVIILPKETYVSEQSIADFKNFILTKIDPKRVKFLKD